VPKADGVLFARSIIKLKQKTKKTKIKSTSHQSSPALYARDEAEAKAHFNG
jgi:hypothetical protein